MKKDSRTINWVFWSTVFFVGTLIFAWTDWHDDSAGTMGLFISISLWSMVCGIGFTLVEWFLWKD